MDPALFDGDADLSAIALAVHTTALAIVNLTPTPKDNLFLTRAYRLLEIVAGLVTRTAKR